MLIVSLVHRSLKYICFELATDDTNSGESFDLFIGGSSYIIILNYSKVH